MRMVKAWALFGYGYFLSVWLSIPFLRLLTLTGVLLFSHRLVASLSKMRL